MPHAVRLATPRDRSRIEEIVRAAYALYIPRIGQPPGPMLDDYAARIRDGQVHVLERDGEIAGLVVLLIEAASVLVDNLAVSPGAQGSGLGRELMAFAEAWAVTSGRTSIRLYTNEAMAENVTFYERLGYVETHRAVEKGYRRVYMAKSLQA